MRRDRFEDQRVTTAFQDNFRTYMEMEDDIIRLADEISCQLEESYPFQKIYWLKYFEDTAKKHARYYIPLYNEFSDGFFTVVKKVPVKSTDSPNDDQIVSYSPAPPIFQCDVFYFYQRTSAAIQPVEKNYQLEHRTIFSVIREVVGLHSVSSYSNYFVDWSMDDLKLISERTRYERY